MKNLKPHRNNPDKEARVEYRIENQQDFIYLWFEVKVSKSHVSKKFESESTDNWGLWDFDVVEVFLQKSPGNYIELQTSPLNQWFSLEIIKPREETAPLKSLGKSKIHGQLTEKGFQGEFIIDKSIIPGVGPNIYGNLTACLGSQEQRSYYALNINKEDCADFHRPELFLKLD